MEPGSGGHVLKAELGGGARPFNELPRTESNRTLLDIIREEGGGAKDGKKTWRHFKEKLRRHNSGGRGSNWTSTVPVPASDIPINNNRMMARNPSTRINSNMDLHTTNQADIPAVTDARVPNLLRNSSISMGRASARFDSSTRLSMRKLQREENGSDDEEEKEEEDESGCESEEKAEEEEERPVRMSLMSLLAETDDNGLMGYMDDEDDDEDEGDDGGVEYSNCCVCMVRHKGTAFEPCGHSFCRLCSRELGVQSGKCPLCNNYILEILDIF